MMIAGLGAGAPAGVHRALTRLAGAACQWPVSDWPVSCLVMMLQGAGQSPDRPCPFRDAPRRHWCTGAAEEPEALMHVLDLLSRFALSRPHLQCASRLLAALIAQDARPPSAREHRVLLWMPTLCHFASRQVSVDPELTGVFAQSYRHFRAWTLADDSQRQADGFDDSWHDDWAAAYWQPAAAVSLAPAGTGSDTARAIPHGQQQLFRRLQQELPDHDLQQEARISQFPVDILIDGRVCVEVDGPAHFAWLPVTIEGAAETVFVRERRTKDLFIDHMLRQSGYRIFRMADLRDPVRCDLLIRQIRAALDAPVQEAPTAGAQEEAGAAVPGEPLSV